MVKLDNDGKVEFLS